MVFASVYYPLWTLEWLEKNGFLVSPVKDKAFILKQELRFLRTYLTLMGSSKAVPSGSSSHSCNVEASFTEVSQELTSACCTLLLNADTIEKVDQVFSRMLKMVQNYRPEIRGCYIILLEKPSKSEYPSYPMKVGSAMYLIGCVLDNLQDLLDSKVVVDCIKEKLEILQENLNFRRNLIRLFASPWIVNRIFGCFEECVDAAEPAATIAACLSYLFWVENADEIMSCEQDVKLSDLLQKNMMSCASDLVQKFVRILKTSMPIKGSNIVACFSNLIQENPVESIRDKVASVGVKLLNDLYHRTKLMHSHDFSSGDLKEPFLEDRRAARWEAASLLVQFKEVNLVLSRMLKIWETIKPETFLLSPSCSEDNLVVSVKDNFATLLGELKVLGTKATKETGKLRISNHVETVTNEVRILIHSIHETRLTEETLTKMNLALFMLLPKIELIKAELNLTELQNQKVNLVSPVKDEIECLLEGLRFLRTFLIDTRYREGKAEDRLLLLKHTNAVVSDLSSLADPLFNVCKMTEDMAGELKFSLSRLVQKIKFIKAETIFVELRNDKVGLTGNMKDKFENLQKELIFLRSFLLNPPRKHKDEGELIFRRSESLANQVVSLILWSYDNWTKEDIALEVNSLISELLQKIVLFKGEIKRIYLEVLPSVQSKYPMVGVLVFISSLSENVRKMLNRKAISIACVKHHIEIIFAELELIKYFLMENLKQHIDHEEVNDLWVCITDVAYKAEYVIDSFVVRDDSFWYFMLWISVAMEEIKVIKTKIMKIFDDCGIDLGDHSFTKSSQLPPLDETVAGLKYEALMIIHQLTGGTKMTDIIAIVGMPGLGNKALAEKVYNDPSVVNFFDSRIWYCLDQEYDHREALIDISCYTDVIIPNYTTTTEYDIEESLYYYFKKRRFHVVIEGWYVSAWDELGKIFLGRGDGSRVLFIC